MPFATLGLSPAVCAPLARLGYTKPTPVQTQSIPVILTGADLLARAQTGTGKTAAFALPMIDRLLASGRRSAKPGSPRGLVLVPTRELAMQVHTSLTAYGAGARVRTAVVFGGVPIGAQIRTLRQAPATSTTNWIGASIWTPSSARSNRATPTRTWPSWPAG